MKREVGIFIETDIAQTELDFSRLELFNDEKISVNSTIQNISDISKIFTDFSQGFTIPCSPTNNAIFQHFYQNDVDTYGVIDYQNRYNAYIEIDSTFFRRGKIQLEKTNLKNGKADSYSITFYGAGVSLKDFFAEDKLGQLDYSTLDHDYTNQEVYDRVTIDSASNDYDVRYPLITSKKVWQFGSSVPLATDSCPSWYNYPVDDSNNIGSATGQILYTDLFPAVRVASLFNLIETKYGITFNGLFLGSDMFKKAFLWFKNKDSYHYTNNAIDLNFNSASNTLGNAFNLGANTFNYIPIGNSGIHNLYVTVVSLTTTPSDYFIDVYKNGVYFTTFQGTTTASPYQFPINGPTEQITFKVRSFYAITVGIDLVYKRTYLTGNLNQQIDYGQCSATAITTSYTDLAGLAPDMKISDFISGICKEFNMTVYSKEKNTYTFDPLPIWYGRGVIRDITQFTDVTSIEIERMKLYKSIQFTYQDSECFMNKAFLESSANVNAHGYGDLKIGFNYDGGEYKIESPFENLLHNNFGNDLQVGYALNKELNSYIPKPVLLYMNQGTYLTGSDKYYFELNGVSQAINYYVPFGQDTNILSSLSGFFPVTLNFGEEISTFYYVNNPNTLYAVYYKSYLENLYNVKNRLVKVKTILPVSLLTQLELNDRLVIRDKRYLINQMQSDLTTGDVNFELISDFAEVKPVKFEVSPVDVGSGHKAAIAFSNGVTGVSVGKSANASNVTLSNSFFTQEGYLEITVPPNAARVIILTLTSDYINGDKEDAYIVIDQQ